MALVVGLDFNTLTAANPSAPVPNWLKPTPASSAQILVDGAFKVFGLSSGTPAAMWYYSTALSSQKISSEITVGAVASRNGGGATLIEGANGNGYGLVTAGFGASVELIKYAAAVRDVTPLLSVTTALVANTTKLKLEYEAATDTLRIFKNGVQIGTDVVDTTYTPIYGGVASRDGRVKSVDIAQEGAMVDSFNGVNNIQRGQLDVVFATTGLGSITSITTDKAGLTFSGIDNTAKTADTSDFVEGGLFPIAPTSFISTFSDGTNTAEITKTLTIKSTESAVVTAGLIDINDSYLGYHFQAAGRSIADGGQIVWPTTANFTISSDGSYSYTGVGDLSLSLWYITPDTGRSYEFDLLFSAEGTVTVDTGFNLSDIMKIALESKGFSGSVTDMFLAWLKANGATNLSIQDAQKEYLIARGISSLSIQDGWKLYFEGKGYSGTLPEMWKTYWLNGAPL